MNPEYNEILSKFLQEENVVEVKLEPDDLSKIQTFIAETSAEDFKKHAESLSGKYYDGILFFFRLSKHIPDELEAKFLEVTWAMFATERKYTDWHPYACQFNPLHGQDPNDPQVELFRRGVILHDFNLADNNFYPPETIYESWWVNFQHFLEELKTYTSKDDFSAALIDWANLLKKAPPLKLSSDMDNCLMLEAFYLYVGDRIPEISAALGWEK